MPCALADFRCPSQPRPHRLRTFRRDRIARICAGFSQLLYDPKSSGISRHIEVQDLSPVTADDEKAVQNTKRERWDGEEVHRSNSLAMVSASCVGDAQALPLHLNAVVSEGAKHFS